MSLFAIPGLIIRVRTFFPHQAINLKRNISLSVGFVALEMYSENIIKRLLMTIV